MRGLLTALCIFGLACEYQPTANETIQVVTAASTIERGLDGVAHVDFTVRNSGRRTAFVSRCGDRLMSAVDRWDGSAWVQYSGDACQAIHQTGPVAILARTERTATRAVAEPGRYRLRIGTHGSGSAAPEWEIASNAFTVD